MTTGIPFHDKHESANELVTPYIFVSKTISRLNLLGQPQSSRIFDEGFRNCKIPEPVRKVVNTLQADHVSGAGQLCNIAIRELASLLLNDEALKTQACADDWWNLVRTYAFHIAKNGRPSMGAVIVTCIVRVLETLSACSYMLSPKSPAARANFAHKIVLGCIVATRKRWSSIPTQFEDYVTSTPYYRQKNRPLTILLQSSSSVIASALTNLFTLQDRPPLRLLVLESRPKFEGVTFAKRLCDFVKTMQHDTSSTVKVTSSTPRPISIEIATDSSVSYLARTADLYLLAADRIYPNGDVSNKIGCLSAALLMRYHGVGEHKKTVVISTTDKISAKDERCSSFEENDGWEVSAAWREKDDIFDDDVDNDKRKEGIIGGDVMGGMSVRNVYFETVPKDLIDVYLTEKGVVDLVEIKEKSKEHWLREVAAFESIL